MPLGTQTDPYIQHPDEVILYPVTVQNLAGRTVASAVWTADGGMTVGANSETDTSSSCFLSTAVDGTLHNVEAAITLDNTEVYVDEFWILGRDG